MFWNKRVISLQNGQLSYYRVPKQMNELSKTQPKISVMIENILYIGPPEKQKKQNSIEITFMAKDAIIPQKSKNRSTNMSINSSYGRDLMASQQPIVITKKKEVIIWEIAFSKSEILKDFMFNIDKVKHPEKCQQKQSELDQQPQEQQTQAINIKQIESPRKQTYKQNEGLQMAQLLEQQRQEQLQLQQKFEKQLEQEKESYIQELNSRIEKEQILEKENKNLLKKLNDQKIQQTEILSKEEQRKIQIKNRIQIAWNYNFLQAIELANMKDPKSIEECITNSFVLHESISRMRDHAQEISQIIIDELCLPNSFKSIKSTDCISEDKFLLSNPSDNTIDFGDDFYSFEGFFIKLSFSQLKTVEIQTNQGKQNIQIYDESQLKAMGNEFRYLSILAEQIELLIQEESTFPLRVPLSCIVDYKGVRAFVLAIPPTDENTLIHGPTLDGKFITNSALVQYLNQLGIILNLKQHQFFEDNYISNHIPMCLFQEVHKITREYLELRWIENESNITDFPPQNLNVNYILKCGDLMPIIIEETAQHSNRLRPEFVRNWNKPLNADVYLQQIKKEENEIDFQELNEACLDLKNKKLHELINKFESLEYLPIDSLTLTEQLHRSGINCKFIGKICSMCQLQHIKDICICDMISRVCKKVLRNNLADLSKNLKLQLSQKLSKDSSNILEFSLIQELTTQDAQDSKIVLELSNQLTQDSCLDFLNLILGIGKESDIFWNQIIQKQIWYDYNYYYDAQSRFTMENKGMLLFCLSQQCDLQFRITEQLIDAIFKEPFPLQEKPIFINQHKSYQLNTSKIARKSRRRNTMNDEQLFQSIKWALELCLIRKEGDDIFSNLLCEESDENASKALSFTKLNHPSRIRPILLLIKQSMNQLEIALSYFEQVLLILNNYFGSSHPYYIIIYSIFGHYLMEAGYYEDSFNLFKSALTCSIRLFQNHQCIAEIYSDIGKLYYLQSDLEKSNQNYDKAISIYQQCDQYQTVKYANTLLLQGELYYKQQNYQNSIQLIEKAIEILYHYEYSEIDLLVEAIKLLIQVFTNQNREKEINKLNMQLQLLQMRHSLIN